MGEILHVVSFYSINRLLVKKTCLHIQKKTKENTKTFSLDYNGNREALFGNALSWNIIFIRAKTTKKASKRNIITQQAIGKLTANNATKLSKDWNMCESAECLWYFKKLYFTIKSILGHKPQEGNLFAPLSSLGKPRDILKRQQSLPYYNISYSVRTDTIHGFSGSL